jgi:serine/threonine protein kinase
MNLLERITKDSCFFDINFYLRGIQKGIQYFHNLDLIYYNLNPTNILMDKDITVIGDFDSY